MSRIDKLAEFYKSSAVVLLNSALLFAVLNVLAIAVLRLDASSAPANPVEKKYSYAKALNAAYPWLDKKEISHLLRETWSRPHEYEAFTQFKERPFSGNYINVVDEGFRLIKDQAAWPPDVDYFNIFVFGGSTTFGYGVADDQTVASYLQETLQAELNADIRVYNFGRSFYFSTQERILFERLLSSGHVPDAAIFIDGLNDWLFQSGEPKFTGRLTEVMDEGPAKNEPAWWQALPIVTLLAGRNQDQEPPTDQPGKHAGKSEKKIYGDENYLENVIDRYIVNKRMIEAIADEFEVVPLFVWQPVPAYKYDLESHVFLTASPQGFGEHLYSKYGYRLFRKMLDEQPLGDNFLWAADIQEGVQELLYVDLIHYSPGLNRMLADQIAQLVAERGLLDARLEKKVLHAAID